MTKPTIIITGASRGLGAAAARCVASAGANVVLNARSGEQLEAMAQFIRDSDGAAVAVPGDISDPKTAEQIVSLTLAHFDRIDGIINNAAVLDPMASIADADPSQWAQNLNINVIGPMLLTQAALPHLRLHLGKVINVSSGAAVSPLPGWSAYCTAKAALTHFTRVLAAEEPSITAVSLRPGVIDTNMQTRIREEGSGHMPKAVHDRFLAYHANGELLPPDLPGQALAFLALYAPHEWSGEFLSWDDDKVQSLVMRYGAE